MLPDFRIELRLKVRDFIKSAENIIPHDYKMLAADLGLAIKKGMHHDKNLSCRSQWLSRKIYT